MTIEIKNQIAQLSAALTAGDPAIASHVATIYNNLKNTPESIHLLTDEEICSIVKGFETTSGNKLAATPAKSKAKAQLSISDF